MYVCCLTCTVWLECMVWMCMACMKFNTHQCTMYFFHLEIKQLESAFYWQTAFTIRLCLQCVLHLTSVGLPGCDGGGVLWWGWRCALPLPLLYPGSLCLHCHAVCHSQGMETNCLQVSLFSARLPACLSALISSFCTHLYAASHIVLYEPTHACVCEYFGQLCKPGCFGTNLNSVV